MQDKYQDGQPCEHKGCLSHLSQPCEGCGRIGGHYDTPYLIKYTEKVQVELASKTRMLNLANDALKRAGSAAQFGIKRDIPEGALVFKDSAESMSKIPDDYCGCEELAEAQAREQVFKKALEKIISFTNTLPYNINGIEEVNRIANEALKQEVKV